MSDLSHKEHKAASCVGKVAFESKSLADRVCGRRKGGKRDLCREPYRCIHCGKWHLGSRN